MAIELIDNPEGDLLEAAFDLIKRKQAEGHKFTNAQRDIGILISLDSLAPTERPWFFEVSQMLKLPLWQVLWGQWRRCQENGMAQAPIIDPGWEGELVEGGYGLEERECPICHEMFKPTNRGQIYCCNAHGAEAEKRTRPKSADEPVVELNPELATPFVPSIPLEEYDKLSSFAKLTSIPPDPVEGESVDLGTDRVEI